MLLCLFCFFGAARAQTPEQSAQMEELARKLQYNPQLIWRAFLDTMPTLDELDRVCNNAEPYKIWCNEEILGRTQYATTEEEKRYGGWAASYLVSWGPEPLAGNAWNWLKDNGKASALARVLENGSEKYQRKALNAIMGRSSYFESWEIPNLLYSYNIPEKYKLEVWSIYLATNPNEDNLAWLLRSSGGLQEPFKRMAFDRLLAFNPEDFVLARLLGTIGEPFEEELANILLSRGPDNKTLREIADKAPEPHKSFTREQLLLRGLERKEILMELMFLNKKPPLR